MIAAPSLVIQPREGESPPPGGRQYGHFLALEVLQPAKNILLSQGTVTNESGGTISGFYGVYANSTISVVNDGVITGAQAERTVALPAASCGIMLRGVTPVPSSVAWLAAAIPMVRASSVRLNLPSIPRPAG